MRLRRGLFVLAIVAALWGAPSSVSAAVNELSSPQVSPSSGSVTTVFTFRVRYEGAFPAASVTVNVAGLGIPMILESGSLTAGWWMGSSLLPVGAWSTTFTAIAPRGPAPTIVGPAVTVAGLSTPAPTATGGTAPGNGPTPESAPVGDPGTPTTPPAAPAPAPAEAPASATAPTASAPASTAPGSAPDPGGSGGSDAPSGGGAVTGSTPEPEIREGSAAGGGGGAGDEPAAQGAPTASRAIEPQPTGGPMLIRPVADTEPRDERTAADETVSHLLLMGLAGVASIAIIGTLLLVAARRREPERATAIPARPAADTAAMRRMPRSSRAHAADDPIVAALGVDDEMAARRAIRRARRQADDGGAPAQPPKGR